MATFRDQDKDGGREWTLRLDAPTILAIREDGDPDFLKGDDGAQETFDRLSSDPVLLCRVIYLLCRQQREQRGLTESEFYLGVMGDGDTIEAAGNALLQAIVSFTPRRNRELLLATAAKNEKVQQLARQKALDKINDPALEESILALMDERIEAEIQKVMTQLKSATN